MNQEPHLGADVTRQSDAGAIRSIGPSQPTDETVSETSSGDALPKDEVIRIEWGYISLYPKVLPWIPSFDYSTRLIDTLNDLMDVIIKRCQSVETAVISPLGGRMGTTPRRGISSQYVR